MIWQSDRQAFHRVMDGTRDSRGQLGVLGVFLFLFLSVLRRLHALVEPKMRLDLWTLRSRVKC